MRLRLRSHNQENQLMPNQSSCMRNLAFDANIPNRAHVISPALEYMPNNIPNSCISSETAFIPLGNFVASGISHLLEGSRPELQQSSKIT